MNPTLFQILVLFQILGVVVSSLDFNSPNNMPNLFMGTGGDGYGTGGQFPGATSPFGASRASPDTGGLLDVALWRYVGGYYYYDAEDTDGGIRTFSHTHTIGAGALDWGVVSIMPTTLPIQMSTVTLNGYRSHFSHDKEFAKPGLYSVFLEDPEIWVNVTSQSHSSIHSYSPIRSKPFSILFDVSHTIDPHSCVNASIDLDIESYTISGYIKVAGALTERCNGGSTVYFYAIPSQPWHEFGTWSKDGTVIPSSISAKSSLGGCKYENIGAYIGYDGTSPIEVRIALSWISVEQAKTNLKMQMNPTTHSFDQIYQMTKSHWDSKLDLIDVEYDSSDPIQTADYIRLKTGLYHSFMGPTTFSEPTNDKSTVVYLGMDDKVHTSDNGNVYFTEMSIWDVYRTQFPLFALVDPKSLKSILWSLSMMYEQGGDVARWPIVNCYAGSMSGSNVNNVLLQALHNNVLDANDPIVLSLYKGLRIQAMEPRPNAGRTGIQSYIKYGYVVLEDAQRAADYTLEYAYNDWALGQIAEILGYSEDAKMFGERGNNWKNVWNSEHRLFCPRYQNGTFLCPNSEIAKYPFDPHWEEGDALQYLYFVPHNIPELAKTFGPSFCSNLDQFLQKSLLDNSTLLPNPYYWAGNEPDIHVPWIGNLVGCPELVQKWVPILLRLYYPITPVGIPGNDDYGCMSAWTVWASIGLYPLTGNNFYLIGTPLFPSITIQIPDEKPFIITVHNFGKSNYIAKASFNGQELSELILNIPKSGFGGASLEIWMV